MGHPLEYAPPPSLLHRRRLTAIYVGAVAWPILLVAGIYAEWLLAWVILGHRPMPPPSPDDPKATLGLVHDAMVLVVFTWPLGMILGLASIVILWITRREAWRTVLWTVILVGLWVGFIMLNRWDPLGLRVIEWFAD